MKRAIWLASVSLLAQPGADPVSLQKERGMGKQLAAEVRKRSQPFDEPQVAGYVERTGRALLAALPNPRLEYQFEVISSDSGSEPFALPGGFVFVPARAFLVARDESEFAGLLAHAIGHAELRHGAQVGSRGQLPLVFTGGPNGRHAETQNPQLALPLGMLASQRTFELEADRFAVELAARAGYDPAGLQRYIARVQVDDPKFSALPERDLRLVRMREVLESQPRASAVSRSGEEFEEIREIVRRVIGR